MNAHVRTQKMPGQGRSQRNSGEGATSVVVDCPGLKGSCIEVEAWHHEESLREAIGEA